MKTLISIEQIISLGFISSTILFTPTISEALTVSEVPNPQQTDDWVTDMADILSDRTEAELNQIITNLETKNGTEIAVVTVPETAPADSPKAFATELFNYWGIGKAEADNGILFLISTADRRVEIETGYGIEAILADAEVAQIIETKITPRYKQDDYDRGTLDGTKALIANLDRASVDKIAPTEVNSYDQNNGSWNAFFLFIGGGITSVGICLWLKDRFGRVLIDPHQAIISLGRRDFRDIWCAKCKQPMQKVESIELNKIKQVAKKIGAVSYRGYTCPHCSNPLQPYSLVAYTSNSSRYQKCPKCQEFTVVRTGEISQPASYTSKGERIIRDTCHCCEYVRETTEIIPRLHHDVNANSGSHTSTSGNYNYYGGGASGYSGGGSSGGFGGGSSDGGGAGGDF